MASLPKLTRNPLDDLFSTESEREDNGTEKIHSVPISELKSFTDHPFRVRNDDKMRELVESVKTNGVITPLLVRPTADGGYEMISGHRRRAAAISAGLSELPCIIRQLDDDEATILMVDSNSQREEILPSEKAFAYKMRLEAMKRQAGRPSKEKLVPVGQNYSREELALQSGESQTQIQRYVRLTNLVPELLEFVDEGRIKMRPAVELSYLDRDSQYVVLDCCERNAATPSHAQAIHLKSLYREGTLTASKIEEILREPKPNQKQRVSIDISSFDGYFPPNTPEKTIKEGIFKALEFYRKTQERENKLKGAEKFV